MIQRIVLVCTLAATACAHIEAPRGGPVEFPLPELVETVPDSGAIVPGFRGPVRIAFQQRISERGLEDVVRVSPRTSEPRIDRHLEEVRVRLADGWRAGIVYQVTVLPGLRDRWDGRLQDTVRVVFSTGPNIPDTRVDGTVRDRITGQPVEGARIELVDPDSIVYETYSGEEGTFTLRNVPDGPALLRVYEDLDRSLTLQEFEPRDTIRLSLREERPEEVSLRLLTPDTLPPALDSVEWDGERAIAHFDRHLDPAHAVGPGNVTLTDADGREIAVERVAIATADVDAAPPEDPDEPTGDEPEPPADDLVDPLPSLRLHVYPAVELPPGSYVLVVEGVMSVHGLGGGGEGELLVEAPDEDDEVEGVPDHEVDGDPEGPGPGESTALPEHHLT